MCERASHEADRIADRCETGNMPRPTDGRASEAERVTPLRGPAKVIAPDRPARLVMRLWPGTRRKEFVTALILVGDERRY